MTPLTDAEKLFIRENLTTDVRSWLLRSHPVGMDIRKLVAQVLARQKARDKLPAWYATDTLIFPPALSVEQASSERTALYKASLVQGALLVDVTGGMGVDTWAFSRRTGHVVYVEQQPELVEHARYNLPLLGVTNAGFLVGDGIRMLGQITAGSRDKKADWLYLDPHRRDEQGGKVVKLDDCEPDITQPGVLDRLLQYTRKILVKVSPLLDIDLALKQLANRVETVHIVAVQGEVKELLFVIDNQFVDKVNVKFNTVNLLPDTVVGLQFLWQEELTAAVDFGNPKKYLYEPNAAVLKAGAFRIVAARYGLVKLAPNSHLYTSDALKADFPGRIFQLKEIIKPDKNTLKKHIPDLKANLTTRNFPQTVAEMRKKLSLREGGSIYILATTLLNGDKRLLITQKADLVQA
ncbi:THUMP-like domain-containing protein [Spirosoma spitsbergense]|uniref:THUMP-like domain-containing protein n=1 Tax=Spirosoma spitsbergense TaxID=431554 RepID=UPI000364E450|nr:class I SAM-dependent methyltransferase [Spirosoma spitsbergense]